MFLQGNNLLYFDRSLFSLGGLVIEAQPHYVQFFFCSKNYLVIEVVPLLEGSRISLTIPLQYVECLSFTTQRFSVQNLDWIGMDNVSLLVPVAVG